MDLASDITSEDLQAFLAEAEEHLQQLDEDFVRLEREKSNPDLLREIFRVAHTLKGSSAMLGHQRMAELAHAMESLLDKVRKGSLTVTTQVVDALLDSLDALTMLKEELVSPDVSALDITPHVAKLQMAAEGEAGAEQAEAQERITGPVRLSQDGSERLWSMLESGQSAYQIKVTLSQETTWAAVRCFQVLEGLAEIGEVLGSSPTADDIEAERVGLDIHVVLASHHGEDALYDAVQSVDEVEGVEIGPYVHQESASTPGDAPPSSDDSTSADDTAIRQRSQKSQTVRIDVDRLDSLMNLVGELIVDRTRILQISEVLNSRFGEDELVQALGSTSAHIARVVDDLQESTTQVRMLPIGTVFSGFPRMVRDLAQKFDKRVDFSVEGEDTEIDRTVIERIRDPLVHILRNALDHGIESPEERSAAGKPQAGTIRLAAYHEQGHIVITVNDDGRGIDPQKLKESAVKKGLLSPEAASRLSDAEAIELIFVPGTSTAEKATDVSGRGVGMDIVKSNIEAINGFVEVDTKVGEGTNFILRLPLTLATLQALLVSLDDITYAIPLVYVVETVVRHQDDISTVEGNEVIRLRENVIPLVRLGTALGKSSMGRTNAEQTWIVVVRSGEKRVGLAVDALVEIQEIVVKSLGACMGNVKGVAGASILGDGRVVLILDVATLMSLIIQAARVPRFSGHAMSDSASLQTAHALG